MTDTEIFELFNYRCVVCGHPATEINHIIPRSRIYNYDMKIDDWRNRVPMCGDHHREYHDGGVTKVKMESLQAKREEMLRMIGKSDYEPGTS